MLRLTLRAAIKARYVSRKATHEHKRPGYAPHERSRATDVGLRQTRHFITVRHDKKCRALARVHVRDGVMCLLLLKSKDV